MSFEFHVSPNFSSPSPPPLSSPFFPPPVAGIWESVNAEQSVEGNRGRATAWTTPSPRATRRGSRSGSVSVPASPQQYQATFGGSAGEWRRRLRAQCVARAKAARDALLAERRALAGDAAMTAAPSAASSPHPPILAPTPSPRSRSSSLRSSSSSLEPPALLRSSYSFLSPAEISALAAEQAADLGSGYGMSDADVAQMQREIEAEMLADLSPQELDMLSADRSAAEAERVAALERQMLDAQVALSWEPPAATVLDQAADGGPVCGRCNAAVLSFVADTLSCRACGLSLALPGIEVVRVSAVAAAIRHAAGSHASTGCGDSLDFQVEYTDGSPLLFARCFTCGVLETVMR